jgi:predicted transcriptional regulator
VAREAWDVTTVGEIMTPAGRLIVTAPEEDAAQALAKLSRNDVRQLPVVSGGRLVGLLRRPNLIKWLPLRRTGARLKKLPGFGFADVGTLVNVHE